MRAEVVPVTRHVHTRSSVPFRDVLENEQEITPELSTGTKIGDLE